MLADMVMEEIDRLKRLDYPAILRLTEYNVGDNSFHMESFAARRPLQGARSDTLCHVSMG